MVADKENAYQQMLNVCVCFFKKTIQEIREWNLDDFIMNYMIARQHKIDLQEMSEEDG